MLLVEVMVVVGGISAKGGSGGGKVWSVISTLLFFSFISPPSLNNLYLYPPPPPLSPLSPNPVYRSCTRLLFLIFIDSHYLHPLTPYILCTLFFFFVFRVSLLHLRPSLILPHLRGLLLSPPPPPPFSAFFELFLPSAYTSPSYSPFNLLFHSLLLVVSFLPPTLPLIIVSLLYFFASFPKTKDEGINPYIM